ncbi:MAG: RNase adapter RapZ [Bacillota bacterium]|nr:RNase adapter RapZ [Bacillota bacterium]
MSFLIITGMSGAGKSQVVDTLEDIGYFCVDNVPPVMLGKFAEMTTASGGPMDNLALVIDARGRRLFETFVEELNNLRQRGISFRLVFLSASDDVLLNRYKEGRRRHPLSVISGGSLKEAIRLEREMLKEAYQDADVIIDTSLTSIAQLKAQISASFGEDTGAGMLVRVLSFGFKYGVPVEADLVFDLRCLPNPFYVDELKAQTGLDKPVVDYVMQWPQAQQLLDKIIDLIDFLLPLYQEEGKSQLVIGLGCTGGRHRSVTFAEAIGAHILDRHQHTMTWHRDIGRQTAG